MTNNTPDAFMEYFRQNYPGPDTIICKPDWHAPKIYRAAISASGHRELLEACKSVAQLRSSIRAWALNNRIPGWQTDDALFESIEAAIEKASQ